MSYHIKEYSNRDEHMKTHKISVEISIVIENKRKSSNEITLDIIKLLESNDDNLQKKIVNYQNCWLLSVACFYNQISVVELLLKKGANTKSLENQIYQTGKYNLEKMQDIIKYCQILEEKIYLEQRIPEKTSIINKVVKF